MAIAAVVMTAVCGICQAQKKSLVIGVDGLGFGTNGFPVANTPVLDSLITGKWQPGYKGAYSDAAIAGGLLGTATQQSTVSGPGWSSMLTGVWTNQHGVTGNGSSFVNGNFEDNPPYIGTLKALDNNLSTVSLVNWGPIDSVLMHAVDTDNDPNNNLDVRGDYANDLQVAQAAAFTIVSVNLDPDVMFVAFDQVDGAGHAFGGASIEYQQRIEITDEYIGQILNSLASRPNFAKEDWQIIVTSDHGHRVEGGHGGQSILERTIPFIVVSKHVRQGELPDGVSHADIAPTVMDHFGHSIPQNYWGTSRADGADMLEPPRTQIAFDDFEYVELQPFDVASGGDGTDWSNVIGNGANQWSIDNSQMTGTTSEGAYFGWTAMDVNSWIAEQGTQIGRSVFATPSHNTILVADPDAWDDFTSDASTPGFNSYVQRTFDLTDVDISTLRIEFDYEFAAEDSQRGTFEISFDGGSTWTLLLDFDSDVVPANTFFTGHAVFNAGDEFEATNDIMTMRFACIDSANDWWFAIDNVLLTVEAVPIGDLNGDGSVDLLDVAPFVDALTNGDYVEAADINGDGQLDLLDVAPFVDLLTN